ncbi:HAD-IA family hydrolase [Georgenia subflava]|uniref:HAD-IA family hydrolase n=1 Tax=Georgenia subflava TaxID=1622177 RepID=A0A6N7EJC9_9MICO|nr:HAD-IA family hydrolase [Georgenia subflava]MPV38190.1 HAD-IA family hydrolase [Georgenia subflava]
MTTDLTLVLDLGQVVVGWDPYGALADRLTRAEWQEFSDAIDFPAINLEMDRGLTHAEAVARVSAAHPERPGHAQILARYCENFAASLTGPMPGTAEIIDELAAADVRLLGLTNWSAETFRHAAPAAPAIQLLDDVVVSGVEGYVKPDPEIFRILLDRHALKAESTVFVDDSPANVSGASDAGLTALQFTDARRLRADLHDLGFPIRRA